MSLLLTRPKLLLATFLLSLAVTALAQEEAARIPLKVSEAQRAHVLHEMRVLLAGTQGVVDGLGRGDMLAVAKHARAVGTGMSHKVEDSLKRVLPPEFRQLGMSVHKDFDQLAADVEAGGDGQTALRQLSAIMGRCVACHARYEMQASPASGRQIERSHSH